MAPQIAAAAPSKTTFIQMLRRLLRTRPQACAQIPSSAPRLSTFRVTVREVGYEPITYPALGTDSAAVIMAAIDRFGACVISAKPV